MNEDGAPERIVKRFIAGAVCPKCGAQDRLVIYQKAGRRLRECVACGFADEVTLQPTVREPTTRVTPPTGVASERAQSVRWVDATDSAQNDGDEDEPRGQ